MLCPFRKRIEYTNEPSVNDRDIRETTEHFEECVGDKCAIYANSNCSLKKIVDKDILVDPTIDEDKE